MNVHIRDRAVFESIDPSLITRHVRARGWKPVAGSSSDVLVFSYGDDASEAAMVWLPQSKRYSDYASVVRDSFATIAEVEKKSHLELLDDLQTQGIGDVIRVSSVDQLNERDYTLALAEGIRLHDQARLMALAGAWNASLGKELRAIHPQTPRLEISSYMKKLRLGQTERGSYVLRLISPLSPPPEDRPELPFESLPEKMPFERRAIMALNSSLKALKAAADDALRFSDFRFAPFEEAVEYGVTANLCEAVAPPSPDPWRPVSVRITWSDLLPATTALKDESTFFGNAELQHINAAAAEFRKRNPERITLRGLVTDLHRSERLTAGRGEIRVYGIVSGRQRYVAISLSAEDYERAVDAHKNFIEISVEGTLLRKPTQLLLDAPENFVVLGDQSANPQDTDNT